MQKTQETQVRCPGGEDPLEEEMATHSSILAWRIPWREKPGRLQSTGSQRVRHDWSYLAHMHIHTHIREKEIKSNLWRAWTSTTSTFNRWECCKVLEQGKFCIFSELLYIIAQLCWVLRLHLSIFPHCLCSMQSARTTTLVRNESDWAPFSGQVRKGFSYLMFGSEI